MSDNKKQAQQEKIKAQPLQPANNNEGPANTILNKQSGSRYVRAEN